MSAVTMKQLLEAGVHFGHQTKRWNPKMKKYIFDARNGIYIIDLQKTIRLFKEACDFARQTAAEGRTVLFVSHNMTAIEQLCNTCILVKKGQIVRKGEDVRGIIKEYLFGEQQDEKRAEWVNPGTEFENPWFKPLRFGLCTESGERQVNPVRNDEDILLEVMGEVQKPHPALALQYTVFADDGTLLFHSSTIDVAENVLAGVGPGTLRLRTRVPRRLLNEGDYRIDLTVFLHNVQFITQYGVNAPTMFLVIQGGLTDSKLWSNKRPGVIAPMIDWTLMPQESGVMA